MTEGVVIKRINVDEKCDMKCEDCEKYFDCTLPHKEVFRKKGIISFIRENMKPVKYQVAILGGKGGVGKSMLAVNLAAGLVKRGKAPLVLDQCYDNPSIPMMLGITFEEGKLVIGEKGFVPYETKWGIKVVSTGLILHPDETIIWFHQMKRNATEEILSSTDFRGVEYLILDVPTGTSSETVNVLKYLPELSGAIVITAASEVAQNVARKCIYVLRKAGVPIIGVVENMSETSCPFCGEPVAFLMKGAGERMAEQEGVPFLASIPMSYNIATTLDEGEPVVFRHPDSEEARILMKITDAVIEYCEARRGAAAAEEQRAAL